jgi:hypothetical protein
MVLANPSLPMQSATMRIYGSFSFFCGILGFFVAFGLVLQHKTYKFTELSFFSFSIINYVFFSYFNFYFVNMLVSLFEPNQVHINKMLNVYAGVLLLLEIGVLILEVLVIYFLERNKWFELRLKLRDQERLQEGITS